MSNKLVTWLRSEQPVTFDTAVLKAGAKKILPWLIGGAAAVGGVILGYKMMNKEPSLDTTQEESTEDDIIVNPILVENER